MKKILLFILLSIPLFLHSQEVVEKISSDNTRILGGMPQKITGSKFTPIGLQFSIYATNKAGKTDWLLRFNIASYTSFALQENSLCLIKTSKGELIELKQTLPDYESRDSIGTYNPTTGITVYNNRGWYGVTPNEIDEIINNGIAKLRFETSLLNEDFELSKKEQNKIVKIIESQFSEANEKLKSSKNIYSDF